MSRIFHCPCGAPMPLTSFKWICGAGHVFNNPQPSPENERVLIAVTEEGRRIKFMGVERETRGPPAPSAHK